MSKENNIYIHEFKLTRKEYLQIFNIDSLITLDNFINTNLSPDMSKVTVLRIFLFSIFEYQKSIINDPETTMNIINNVLSFMKKSDKSAKKIYNMILKLKDQDDFILIKNYIND